METESKLSHGWPAASFAQRVLKTAAVAEVAHILVVTDDVELAASLRAAIEEERVSFLIEQAAMASGLEHLGVRHFPLSPTGDPFGCLGAALRLVLEQCRVRRGQRVLMALTRGLERMIVVATADGEEAEFDLTEILSPPESVRPEVLAAALDLACNVGGRMDRVRYGAMFVIGDIASVLRHAEQILPNPLFGHPNSVRQIEDPTNHAAILELAKLQGAFVISSDGRIERACAWLTPRPEGQRTARGPGACLGVALALTEQTNATAIVVSAEDGLVRAFAGGAMVLQMEPDPTTPLGTRPGQSAKEHR